jgi:hypothetical protein
MAPDSKHFLSRRAIPEPCFIAFVFKDLMTHKGWRVQPKTFNSNDRHFVLIEKFHFQQV